MARSVFKSSQLLHALIAGNPRLSGLAWKGYVDEGPGVALTLFEKGLVYGGFVPQAKLGLCIDHLPITALTKQDIYATLIDQVAVNDYSTCMILLSVFTKGDLLAGHVNFGSPTPQENWRDFEKAIFLSQGRDWHEFRLILLSIYTIHVPSMGVEDTYVSLF